MASDPANEIDGNTEGNTAIAAAGGGDGGVDADDLAIEVEQRAAAGSRVDRGVGLQEVLDANGVAQSDLATLAGEVRDVLRGLASAKRLRVEIAVAPGIGTVTVDPARVKQILYNYLSNAIKFTGDDGRIDIRMMEEGPDDFRLEVEDTAVGIDAADLPNLFLEFHQLDASAAKKYQGTGLGLALTKRLAEAHGGTVGVRSTPGAGSTFSAVLPRVLPPPILSPRGR